MSKTKISPKRRTEILERDGRKCLWCGRSVVDGIQLEVDHILSEKFKGKSTSENLGTLCLDCNRGKSEDYFGNYLLATIFKAPNLNKKIIETELKSYSCPDDGRFYDGDWYRLGISFFRKIKGSFQEKDIYHIFMIDRKLLVYPSPHSEISVRDIKDKARLELKNKMRDYLFKNKGFLEEQGDNLIFRERKMNGGKKMDEKFEGMRLEDMKILVSIKTATKEELVLLKKAVEKETPETVKDQLLKRIGLREQELIEGR